MTMDDTKRAYREAEETTREAWRNRDGEDLADKVGNLGDDIRKGLGNAGDEVREGLDEAGDRTDDRVDDVARHS
jgi:hypothetical protein